MSDPILPVANVRIEHVEVPGPILQAIVWEKLMPALEGLPVDHCILALIAFSILLMKPDVTMEELSAAIKNASESISLTLMPVDQKKVN